MKNHQTLVADVAAMIVVAYNNARGYARCVKAVLNRWSCAELSISESELAGKYRALSVATLYQAKETDFWRELAQGILSRDPDLDVVRNRQDFKQLTDEVLKTRKGNHEPDK